MSVVWYIPTRLWLHSLVELYYKFSIVNFVPRLYCVLIYLTFLGFKVKVAIKGYGLIKALITSLKSVNTKHYNFCLLIVHGQALTN